MYDAKRAREYNQQLYVKERRRKVRMKSTGDDVLNQMKESTPCADCGKQYPHHVMDFDHRPGAEKLFKVSDKRAKEQRIEEAKKCDIVCSNCHRQRTATRRGVLEGTERWTTESSGAYNRGKTHCKYGHEFTEENTYYQTEKRSGYVKRRCRACGRQRNQERRSR